ncbi:hypothetical protein ACF1G0_34825 [Streptomyces sp. NPDC013953]|uniref:hypothetical protein n=1 Tax=Streptomyces sp. NPDC013953 TaxID=3364868 RepID=UPI0036F62E66
MNTLNWRTAAAVELNDKLIPDPNAQHNLLDRLYGARVAVDGAFLHIDPRPAPDAERHTPGTPYDVYVVPASAVRVLRYQQRQDGPPNVYV